MENGKINVSSIDVLIIEDNIFIVIFHVSSARDRQPDIKTDHVLTILARCLAYVRCTAM